LACGAAHGGSAQRVVLADIAREDDDESMTRPAGAVVAIVVFVVLEVAFLSDGLAAASSPKPSWAGLLGINLGMTRKAVKARFGAGVALPVVVGGQVTEQKGCRYMSYPNPGAENAVFVEFRPASCGDGQATVVRVETGSQSAALPDGTRVGGPSVDPLTQSNWNGYRAEHLSSVDGYHWVKTMRVKWPSDLGRPYVHLHRVELEVSAGRGLTGINAIRITDVGRIRSG
jgi:hypothetical protein